MRDIDDYHYFSGDLNDVEESLNEQQRVESLAELFSGEGETVEDFCLKQKKMLDFSEDPCYPSSHNFYGEIQ